MYKFPSIIKFIDVAYNVKTRSEFVSKDNEGNVIYDETKPKPTLTFIREIKLHGSNAAIVYDNGRITAQSRERELSLEKDNAGFYAYVFKNEERFKELLSQLIKDLGITNNKIVVFGEWAGQGIQKGVAISNIEKSLFIFDIAEIKDDVEENESPLKWIDLSIQQNVFTMLNFKDTSINLYSILNYDFDYVHIDFNTPFEQSDEFENLCQKVGEECPVGKAFGFIGHGEGHVYRSVDGMYRFKVKSENHKTSKVKTTKPIDENELNSINEFVDAVVTENRLEQGISYLKEMQIPLQSKSMGQYIKWVNDDVIKEENNIIAQKGLDIKKVKSSINNKAREFFNKKLNGVF